MNCWDLREKNGYMTGITFTDDPLKMNWIRENGLWGKVTAPAGLHCKVEREILPDNRLEETYCFCNQTEYDIASCAMIYPRSVNGTTAGFFDPWANDQDWGLYYYFRRGKDFLPDS